MKLASAADLLERARAALASGQPEMSAHTARSAVANYLDAPRFARECELMRRYPLPVCAASELHDARSWWSGDVLETPLLLTRDAAGHLHAHLNVCRHRGARVVAAGQGCDRQRFACPYHAWTYSSDGALLSIPKAEGFPDVDAAQSGLVRLAVAECAGLIWVVLDPRCAGRNVQEMLGPLAQELDGLGLDTHVGYAVRELELRCNWKLMVEGSSEAYHFKVAHRDTIAPMFVDNLQIVDEHGLNRRMFLVKDALREYQPDASSHIDLRKVGNLLYYFFPATLILVQPDHAQVTRLEPRSTDLTHLHELTLIPQLPDSERAKTHWDRNVKLYRDTLGEDYALMESIQAGLRCGANTELRFGRYEPALARFHQQLDAALTDLS